MNKFDGVKVIVQNVFSADLKHLDVEYTDDSHIIVHVEYQDKNFIYDYDLEIDKKSHQTTFIQHHSIGHGFETDLRRNVEFEHKVEEYILHQ